METREERIAWRDKQIAERDKQLAEWEIEYPDDWEKLPKRKIMVMGQEIEICEDDFETLESLADDYGYRGGGEYLTDALGLKWNNQAVFTLEEVLLTEIDALANE